MKINDDFFTLVLPVTLLVALSILCNPFSLEYLLNKPACLEKWKESGIKSRWSFHGGCQLQNNDGTWFPDKTLRKNYEELSHE